jgi:hypothetical protein
MLSWLTVALVPVAMLAVEVSLTQSCTLPSGRAGGQMRLIWHQLWLISAMATIVPVVYLAWRAPTKLLATGVVVTYALWKGVAVARDRVALPVCVEGWGDVVPRDPADLPLTLVSAASFTLFVFIAGLAASLRRARLML